MKPKSRLVEDSAAGGLEFRANAGAFRCDELLKDDGISWLNVEHKVRAGELDAIGLSCRFHHSEQSLVVGDSFFKAL